MVRTFKMVKLISSLFKLPPVFAVHSTSVSTERKHQHELSRRHFRLIKGNFPDIAEGERSEIFGQAVACEPYGETDTTGINYVVHTFQQKRC